MIRKRIAKSTFRKFSSILAVLFLLFGSFALLTIPPVHAVGPTRCTDSAMGGVLVIDGTHTWTFSPAIGAGCAVVGNVVILQAYIAGGSVTSITDDQLNKWTKIQTIVDPNVANSELETWTTILSTTTSPTLTPVGSGFSGFGGATVFSGAGAAVLISTFGFGAADQTGGVNLNQPVSFTYPSNSVVMAYSFEGWKTTQPTMIPAAANFGTLIFETTSPNEVSNANTCQYITSCNGFTYYIASANGGSFSSSVVCTANCLTGGVAAGEVFGGVVLSTSSSSTTQTYTVGSCPTKNTATTTLANNTGYFYEANSLGQSTVNSLSSFLASNTLAGATTNNLVLSLYVGVGGSGVVNIANPLTYITGHTFTIHMGDKNNALSTIIGTFINSANTPFAVMIQGTDKIKINQSGLAGMFSVATSGTTPPATITNLGTNVAQLYLCMSVSYQSVITVTTTSTVTNTVTSGNTTVTATITASSTSTITSTLTTVSSTFLSSTSNWPIVFLLLFMPMGLLLGVTRNLVGALLGTAIGAVICLGAGLIPNYVFLGLVICIAGCAFVVAKSSGGGGTT